MPYMEEEAAAAAEEPPPGGGGGGRRAPTDSKSNEFHFKNIFLLQISSLLFFNSFTHTEDTILDRAMGEETERQGGDRDRQRERDQ